MKVLNVHTRRINQPLVEIIKLFETLSSENDKMLATDKWPRMKLDQGLKVGSKGGHGPIRYSVEKYIPGQLIQFKFYRPRGFNGHHTFEIKEVDDRKTLLTHLIKMDVIGKAIITWSLVTRWLHDAYIEDAFDNVENHFLNKKKRTKWNSWVRFLRRVLAPKKEAK